MLLYKVRCHVCGSHAATLFVLLCPVNRSYHAYFVTVSSRLISQSSYVFSKHKSFHCEFYIVNHDLNNHICFDKIWLY